MRRSPTFFFEVRHHAGVEENGGMKISTRSATKFFVAFLFLLLVPAITEAQQLKALHGRAGSTATEVTILPKMLPDVEVRATFRARLTEAAAKTRGEVWFTFTSEFTDPANGQTERVLAKVPISSTEDAYGEERSCNVASNGTRVMVFTAGMDEKNFVGFHASAGEAKEFSFLLNKYLCRILAAPFKCGDKGSPLSAAALEMKNWRVVSAGVMLSSASAAALEASEIEISRGNMPFDYESCAKIAPSSGLCCVQGKTTEWSCGASPVGSGWHQVSGECFHRETGGSCKDSDFNELGLRVAEK